MKIYIYTVPKAGTYLLAEFMERMGVINTGFHLERDHYLDTKALDLKTNTKNPSASLKEGYFLAVLNSMNQGELAFGHLSVPLCAWAFPDLIFICSHRHPKKTLASEFIDFRFRRFDVEWLSPDVIPDDQDAFLDYLMHHGPIHMSIVSEMLAACALFKNPLFNNNDTRKAVFINFDSFLQSEKEAMKIIEFLNLDTSLAAKAWKEALEADTKTKAKTLEFSRKALWTDSAEQIFEELHGNEMVRMGRELGLDWY